MIIGTSLNIHPKEATPLTVFQTPQTELHYHSHQLQLQLKEPTHDVDHSYPYDDRSASWNANLMQAPSSVMSLYQ
ncbi:hypothetical protein Sjap_026399 [Stephania japonica]|uniref:Uncharacterized protein n=1 Tax=Stephania japonica TaxID=461633 RepID=A0AAP0EBC2_9MAGN